MDSPKRQRRCGCSGGRSKRAPRGIQGAASSLWEKRRKRKEHYVLMERGRRDCPDISFCSYRVMTSDCHCVVADSNRVLRPPSDAFVRYNEVFTNVPNRRRQCKGRTPRQCPALGVSLTYYGNSRQTPRHVRLHPLASSHARHPHSVSRTRESPRGRPCHSHEGRAEVHS